jgi:hypothetical protein
VERDSGRDRLGVELGAQGLELRRSVAEDDDESGCERPRYGAGFSSVSICARCSLPL